MLVLAALLAQCNTVVSADQLVDVLWGDNPPHGAWSTVQKYVYRLRTVLEPSRDGRTSPSVLVTRSPGYVLSVAPEQVDARRFVELVTGVSVGGTDEELAESAARISAALAMWRGNAWGDFADHDFARGDALRLEDLRTSAMEDAADIALAQGRHTELVGSLESAVDKNPLRERPRAQLMLALYRSGRATEALRAYQSFRRYLVAEAGLEPSATLQRLEQDILGQSTVLDWVNPRRIARVEGRPLPTGVVTFMFTDVEKSTRLFRQLGARYVELLERHRTILRAAVAKADGVEVNSEGDGLFFAFASAERAVAASAAGQFALLAEPWPDDVHFRVRIGLHTGEATPRDGDYMALPVHEAARVAATAHGGQIVASAATAAAAGRALKNSLSLRRLGTFELRDIDQPVELFQVCHPQLLDDFPAPVVTTLTPLAAELVSDGTPFVGRTAELQWLDLLWRRALDGQRTTIALCGPSGIGKTRLAIEFARRVHRSGVPVDFCRRHRPERVGDTLTIVDDVDPASVPDGGFGLLTIITSTVPADGTRVGVRELAGLEIDEVTELLCQPGREASSELARAVLDETGGNPALVLEIVRRLQDQEAAARVERALARADAARADLREVQDDIAAGVMMRRRLAARGPSSTVGTAVCPYKGLARFDEDDWEYFCGRERLVATLVARLAVARFVAIVGASGSGKSSLARAGLLPALAGGALPGSERWHVAMLTPGDDPLGRLHATVAAHSTNDSAGRLVIVIDQFEEVVTVCQDDDVRSRFFDALVEWTSDTASGRSVVAVLRADYYGELATHPDIARSIEQSQVLVGAMTPPELQRAVTEPALRAGLRIEPGLAELVCRDAGDEPGSLPLVSTALVETWARRRDNTLTVEGYVEAGGVRAALTGLAETVYQSFDVDGQDAARRVLLRLATPGIGSDDVRRQAPRPEIAAIPGGEVVADTMVARRLLTADSDTVEVAHEALLREWPRLRAWLEEDRDGRRLHRQLSDTAAAWQTERRDASLLYRGARLGTITDWLQQHPGDLNDIEQEFVEAAVAREEQEVRAAKRTTRRLKSLTTGLALLLVVALLAGGLALNQRRNATHQASRAQSAATQAEASRLAALARTLGSDQTDLALLLGIEGHRLVPSNETEGGLESALVHVLPGVERVLRTGSSIGLAAVSADGRYLAGPTLDGTTAVWDLANDTVVRTLGHTGSPADLASFSSDGRLVVVGHTDGTVDVFDATTGLRDGASLRSSGASYGLFASPTGSRLVVVSPAPGTQSTQWQATVFDRTDPSRPVQIGNPMVFSGPVGGADLPVVGVSPDGTRLTAGDTPSHVWDLESQTPLPDVPARDPVFAADNVTIAGDEIYDVATWNTTTGQQTGAPFPSIEPSVPGRVVLSADGRSLAMTDVLEQGRIFVYDVATRVQTAVLNAAPGARPVGFASDGRLMVSEGNEVLEWRPNVHVPPIGTPLGTADGSAFGLWRYDAGEIVTFGTDPSTNASHPMLLWDGVTGAPRGRFLDDRAQQNGMSLWSFALKADGRLAAVASPDGLIHIWDRVTGQPLSTLGGQRAGGELGLAWTADGRTIASVGYDQAVLLWDVTDPRHPVRTGQQLVLPGEPGPTAFAPWLLPEFSRDGRLLLVNDVQKGNVSMFEVASGARLWTNELGRFSCTGWVGYSVDNEILVGSGATGQRSDRQVTILDAHTGKASRVLSLPDAQCGDLLRHGTRIFMTGTAPAPDGVTQQSVVRLYDGTTGEQIGVPIPYGSTAAGLQALQFGTSAPVAISSPDDLHFLTGTAGPAESVTLWTVNVDDWETTACRVAGRNLTKAEWAQYLPDRPYRMTCPQWPAGN